VTKSAKKGVLSPGDRLDSYRIEELIGVGGAGEVYRATNVTSERMVAIKVLLAENAQDQDHLERMRRELHDIVHPAVVRYLDMHGTEAFGAELHYLVMEFIPGPSLAGLMKEKPIDPDILTRVARAVLGGLEACHKGQIFHRDISPDNIILRNGDPDKATLIDFGIAKDVRPDAKTVVGKGFAGKYEYAAPEQMDGGFDQRSDLYSLGATLLAAARGKVPDLGNTLVDVIRIKQAPVDTSGLPEPLHGLLAGLLATDPDRRPRTAGEAVTLLGDPVETEARKPSSVDAMLSGLSANDDDAKVGKSSPPPPRKSRKKTVLALLGCAAVVLAALLFVPALRDAVFGPGLPTVSPYTLTMARDAQGGVDIEGHAPSEDEAAALAETLGDRLDAPGEAQITAALGAPGEEGEWSGMAAALAEALARLEQGRATMEDDTGALEGVAPTPEEGETVERAIREAAARYRFDLDTALDILPQPVGRAGVVDLVDTVADCGPLSVGPAPGGEFAAEAEIDVTGAVGTEETLQVLRERLAGVLDRQTLALDGIDIINPSVCRVRSMLPPDSESGIVIDYRSGLTGEVLTDDYFEPTDSPIVDLLIPSDRRGYLHAFLVDNEFNTLHLRPGPRREGNRLLELGEVSNGVRNIRILFPRIEGWDDAEPYIGFTQPYGEMRFYVVVTDEPLFRILRGNQEDTRDFVPDLASSLAEQDDFLHAERSMRVRLP